MMRKYIVEKNGRIVGGIEVHEDTAATIEAGGYDLLPAD